MNLKHLSAFVWLRSRIRVNQFRKGGTAGQIILVILTVMMVTAGVGLFVGGFFAGLFGLPAAPSAARLLIWDGVVVGFLFVWMIGLLTELQRSEPLTLEKFLHLPVSPAGVFIVNYVSSLFSITLVLFAAAAFGLLIGQLFAVGPIMLFGVIAFAAFVFAATALTYQFQGWLAVLMSNPRRRRTVIVFVTFGFILLVQIPNLINIIGPWRHLSKPTVVELPPPTVVTPQTPPDPVEPVIPTPAVPASSPEKEKEVWERVGTVAWWTNLAVPPGWFPLGVAELAEGRPLPALLGSLAFVLIGGACLWRAYRTTVKYHTGQYSESSGSVSAAPAFVPDGKPVMVEWRWPWVSEHASAVASSSLRGLLRAPESKMMLIAPVIMALVFGGMLFAIPGTIPGPVRPLIAVGAAAVVLLAGIQIAGNQFGYDRAGFRAYVLSPISRRDILLGKNLSVIPLLLAIGGILALLVSCVLPMRIDHYPMILIQLVSLFLLFCLLSNTLSIVAPMPIAAGAMQPTQVKLGPILWQFGFMMFYPFVIGLVLLPVGVEVLIEELSGVSGWPIALLLSVGVSAFAVFAYHRGLSVLADLLTKQEKDILQIVTSKVE